MSASRIFFLSLVVCAILLPRTEPGAIGAEPGWVLLEENALSAFYLDLGTGRAGGKTPRATVRVVYTEQGRRDALDTLKAGKTLEGLSESRYWYDLDCAGQRSKLGGVSHLDKNGAVLKTSDLEKVTSWEPIPAGARLSLAAEKVCPPKNP